MAEDALINMKKLTLREENALQAIWKTGEGNLKLIMDNLPAPKPPYTTFASIVKNLVDEGYVKARIIGNTYFYKASLTKADYAEKYMSGFVRSHFKNSYKDLVSFFVTNKKIKPKDLKEILEMIKMNKPA
jgi:BlaI family penicillinase repressor